jgi:hypothetical protein
MQPNIKNLNIDIPKPFRMIKPGRLEIAEGGGCLCIFGFPFFAIGIFLILASARILPMENVNNQPEWTWIILGLMAVPFTAVGGNLLFGRRKIIIDTTSRQIYRQFSVLVPLKNEVSYLHDYERVIVRLQTGDSDSVDSYPVFLKAKPTTGDLRLFYSNDYGDSRVKAEFLARFLQLPLEDASTDHAKIYVADSASAAFSERLQGQDEEYKSVPAPLEMRSRISESAGIFEITIPQKGFKLTMFLPLLFSFLIWLFLRDKLFPFFRVTHTPQTVGAVIFTFISIMFVVIPLLAFIRSLIAATKGYSRLTVNAGQLKLHESTGLGQRTRIIALADIVDIDYNTVQGAYMSSWAQVSGKMARQDYRYAVEAKKYGSMPRLLTFLVKFAKSKGIIIKTKKGLFPFGYGLEDKEVLYLYFRIKDALRKQVNTGAIPSDAR